MKITNRLGWGAALAVSVALVVGVVQAWGDDQRPRSLGAGGGAPSSVLGETFFPDLDDCRGATLLQTGSPGGASEVSSNGVITSYEVILDNAPGELALKVGRPGSKPGTYAIVGSSPIVEADDRSLVHERVRIPARKGDVIGTFYGPADPPSDSSSLPSSRATPDPAESVGCVRPRENFVVSGERRNVGPGEVVDGEPGDVQEFQLDLSVTLEGDADGDGFGDRSQDSCATDPTTHAPCRTSAPRTVITSASVRTQSRAVIRFRASERSSFRCAVDSKKFRACRSPFRPRLSRGRHVVRVVATDLFGNADRSPARRVVVKR